MFVGETVFFVPAKTTYKDADRRGPGGDRKAPWLLWGKRATGIGLETDNPLSKAGFRPHGRPKGFPIAPWTPSDASSLICPWTRHPKPKGLGDCLYGEVSFLPMLL